MAMSFSEWKKKREENGQGTSRPSAASTTSHSPSTATSGGSSGSRSFSEWKSDRDAKKPTSAIEDWWKSSEALVSEVQLYYNSWKSDEDKFNAFQEKASNLLSIADGLRKQYSGNDEAVSAINSVVDALSAVKKYSYNYHKYYSRFDSEKSYNDFQIGWLNPDAETNEEAVAARKERFESNAARIEEIKGQLPWYVDTYMPSAIEYIFLNDEQDALKAEMEMLEGENQQYQRTQGVLDRYYIPVTEEFQQNAGYRDYFNASKEDLWAYDMSAIEGSTALSNGGYFDEAGNIYDAKGNLVQSATAPQVTDKLGMFLSASDEEITEAYNRLLAANGNHTDTWANLMREGDHNSWKYLTEHEIGIYYDLYKREGQEAAYKFLSDMTTELNRRETQKTQEYINGAPLLEQIFLNVASIPMSVVGGALAFAEDATNVLQGNDINPYSKAHAFLNSSRDIRIKTATDINNLTGNAALPFVGTTFGDVYQSIMSFGDSVAVSVIPGGYALLGMNAASTEMKDIYERGGSTEQIFAGGLLAGAAEMFFEKVSMGKLKEIRNMDTKAVKRFADGFVRAVVMGGVEASEEMATEIANTISDALVMGSRTDWVDMATFVKNVVNAGIGGFISGGLGGSIAAKMNNARYNQQMAKRGQEIIDSGGVDALQRLAMEMSGSNKAIGKLSNKVSAKATAKNVGKLSGLMGDTTTAQNLADITKSLEEKGLSQKDAKRVAEYLNKASQGEYFTEQEAAEAMGNKKIAEVLRDVIADPKSSINARTIKLINARLGKATQTEQSQQGEEIVSSEGNLTSKEESASESHYEVSEDGHMINTKTGDTIEPQGLAQAENGTYKIAAKDADPVSNSDVSYADSNQALVYETFMNLEDKYGKTNKVIATMDLDNRNALLGLYNPEINKDGGVFANGAVSAFFYGHQGIDLSAVPKTSPVWQLTEQQRKIAWNQGRIAGVKATNTAQRHVDTTYEEAQKVLKQTGKTERGSYHAVLEDGITPMSLNESQKAVYRIADDIAQGVQTNIRVYAGKNKAQGFYNHATDEIWLNLNAANSGREAIMAFTLSHELVHRAKKGSPAKYKAFVEFLMKEYGKQGTDVDALIAEQMAAAEEFNKTVPDSKKVNMTREKAFEEVVCDACQRMLLDTNAGQKLAEFGAQSKQNKGFLEDLKRWISEFFEKLRNYFKGVDPDSKAAKEFAKFDENVKQILADMYVDMSIDAGEKLSTIKAAVKKSQVENNQEEKSFSLPKGEPAPTFYSHMARVVDGVKQEKLGAASVVNMLRGRGVKAEEIKWSGIEGWLEGKKSVTKEELQEFINGSQLQIEETVLDGKKKTQTEVRKHNKKEYGIYIDGKLVETVTKADGLWRSTVNPSGAYDSMDDAITAAERKLFPKPKWGSYIVEGGTNYREVLFKLPGTTYSNDAMKNHWGKNAQGVLAHARVQDFDAADGKMLFIEEIQSDWHNEGHNKGYIPKGQTESVVSEETVPDAPFKDTYHEFVLKRLIREAAENGYDSIGWTTADIQSQRWSDEFAEGYRIEYDQDIPKFLKKYGKQWGAEVGKTTLDNGNEVWSMAITDSMKDSVLYEGQVMYSLPKVQNQPYRKPAYEEWQVETALVDALDHADKGDDNLILVGEMPRYITDKLGIEGDFFIYRNHAYENMVSRDKAIEDGRPITRKGEAIHFHDLGIEKMTDAVMALENPIMAISTKTSEGNPAVVMLLPVKGKNNAPLYAVLSFYSNKPINGDLSKKPHIVLTIAERDFFGSNGRSGYAEIVGDAVKDGRVIDFNKEMRDDLSVIANPAGVGNITESSLTNNLSRFLKEIKSFREKNNIDYKLPIGEDTSPRALLANAFEGIITNDIEKRKIQEYKGKVEMLNAEEQKLHELRAQIKELSFAKGPRDTKKIKDLQFDANQTANRIATLDKMLLGLEASAPLQNILKREKEMAYKRAEQKSKEDLEAYKKAERERDQKWQSEVKEKYQASKKKAIETREKREAREKLQKLVLDTVKWISYPAKTDVKCPDILKQPYADFLNGIDLSSQRQANGGDPTKNDLRLANAMGSLATALDKIMTSQDPAQETDKVLDTGYLDLPADFVKKLRDMTEKVKAMMVDGDYVVNNMSAAEVRQLSQMIRTLNHAIKEVSTLYANFRFANVEALGNNTMEFMDALGENEKTGGVKDFVQWDNALPYYVFKRFGEGGESIFEGLMDAQDKLAFLAQNIFDFREKAWTDKEAKAWSEDTHTIDLPNGNTLTLTTADAMSIFCLSRREHGLQHLLGGGTRVLGLREGSKKAKDSRSLLTIKDIDAINSSLTDRQKQVAEGIQEFMSTVCSEWGNEISMKRFLTKDFTEKFYFPIESNDENLPTKDPAAQQSDLFRLLNISATKPLTPGANNEVIIRNIFDVFTSHASDMARLNAYGMALLDYMKWLNYREKAANEEGQIKVRGVRKSMQKAYGDAAMGYVLNLVKDVNGRASDGGDPNILMKWMRSAKTASVGNSLRVATLQITSYPRAALVLSPESLALGLTKIPNINRAKKYCGIALWKSFGFYDTNISRSIEDQMKGVTNVKQKLIELSLKGAEWGDAITWGALWNACEYEVAKTTKNKVGSEEFYQEVGKKLREVVYRTQVVDSTLTRSQLMRSKRGMAQEATAFMSEPTLSANILMDAGFEFNMEKRRTGSAKTAWKKTGTYIGKAVAVYSIGQLTAALIEALWDAWRDEEDEEFGKKYLDAFIENLTLDLVPFNKVPIVSDVFEGALSLIGVGYYSSDKMSSTWLSQAVSAVDAWKKVLSGESSATAYNALYKSIRALSSYYGVAFSGLMREGVALWNNTAGTYDITWKIRQYEMSKTGLGNALYDAIISGNNRQAESIMDEFRDRTGDEKEYQSAITSAIRKALRENDPRIREAAQAQINGNPSERVRIAKLIIADGFAQDDVVVAINAEINAIMFNNDSAGAKKEKGFYTAEDFAREIANGDQSAANAAKVDIIQTAQKNGKTAEDAEESFVSSAKSALGDLYISSDITTQKLTEALRTCCGMDDDEVYWQLDRWDYVKETGSTDGYGKYNNFHTAVKTGKDLKMVIKEYTDHGVEEKTLASQITSYFKPLYKEMSNYERAAMKGYLLNAYVMLGYNRSEKSRDIDKWLRD